MKGGTSWGGYYNCKKQCRVGGFKLDFGGGFLGQ